MPERPQICSARSKRREEEQNQNSCKWEDRESNGPGARFKLTERVSPEGKLNRAEARSADIYRELIDYVEKQGLAGQEVLVSSYGLAFEPPSFEPILSA